MYWFILIVCSIPVYLLIGWTVFDTGSAAKDTFLETVVAILKIILIPRIVRLLMGMDDEGAYGIFPIALFVSGCVAITFAEHVFLDTYFFNPS